jgi:sodium/potassium-transporting ATPase subunit alpha
MEVIGAWIDGQIYDDIHSVPDVDPHILRCFAGSTMVKLDFTKPLPEDLSGAVGDATELGLFRYACARKYDFSAFFGTATRVLEIPFDSSRKWNLTIMREPGGLTAYLKGAPDVLAVFCGLDDAQLEAFNHAYRHFAAQGQRVIGFATRQVSEGELDFYRADPSEIALENFSFLGMLSIYDPPKEGVAEAVRQLRNSGIKIFMVTGDHPITAKVFRAIHTMHASLGDCKENWHCAK